MEMLTSVGDVASDRYFPMQKLITRVKSPQLNDFS